MIQKHFSSFKHYYLEWIFLPCIGLGWEQIWVFHFLSSLREVQKVIKGPQVRTHWESDYVVQFFRLQNLDDEFIEVNDILLYIEIFIRNVDLSFNDNGVAFGDCKLASNFMVKRGFVEVE